LVGADHVAIETASPGPLRPQAPRRGEPGPIPRVANEE
jgi:hypothetical protein